MEGVQFLLRDPVYVTEYSWGFSWAGLTAIILSLVTLSLTLHAIRKKWICVGLMGLITTLIAVGTAAGICSTATETEVYSHAEYQVTISDDVKLKEFMENYEIVDVKDDIYTIVIKSELESPKELAVERSN